MPPEGGSHRQGMGPQGPVSLLYTCLLLSAFRVIYTHAER
nr:MAG TPA: hypothetical protein [Caudoviricetes sp.]